MNKEDLYYKCIKYSSDVTEEMFNAIVKKVESLTTVNYILENEYKAWYDNLKKGDYIVCINSGYNIDIPKNYIFKFIKWQTSMKEGWIIGEWLNNNRTSGPPIKYFRPATPEEIKMYEHAGKPVDVTTYKLFEEITIPEYVKCISIRVGKEYTVGNIYKTEKGRVRNNNGYLPATSLCSNLKNYYNFYDFEPSTKEEFEKQQVVIKTVEIKSEFIHVNDLVIDKVYKCSYNNDGKYHYWKYLGKDSDKPEKYYWIKTTPYLKPDEKYLAPLGGFSNKQYTDYIKEATTEESAWYEKCLKENKYISFEEFKNMKEETSLNGYSVGDWCYIFNPGTSKLTKGNIYQINQIDSKNPGQKYHFDDGSGKINNRCWMYLNNFRKATPEEILKSTNTDSEEYLEYKVGDKVIITKRPSYWASSLCSKDIRDKISYPFVATIEDLKKGDNYIVAKIGDGGWDLTVLVNENCIEKYVEPTQSKFEVDKWYIYSDKYMLGCYVGNNRGYGLKQNLTIWSDSISMSDNNWKPATKEEMENALFEYAKKKYPIGTSFKLVHVPKSIRTVTSHSKEHETFIYDKENKLHVNLIASGGNDDCNSGSVYYDGKWAEIVSSAVVEKESMEDILEEAKKRFPIGCKYYPVHSDGTHSTKIREQKKECYIYEDWILGSYNVRSNKGIWAKLYEEPKKPKFKYKFKIGDKVLAVHSGMGISTDSIKKYSGRIYTITELGEYTGKPGYKVSPAVGNTLSGNYNGFIDQNTFELYKDEESIPVEWINKAQEIYKSKGIDALEIYILTNTDYLLYEKLPGSYSKEKAKLFVEYCSLESIERYPLTPEESLESSIKLKKFEINKL